MTDRVRCYDATAEAWDDHRPGAMFWLSFASGHCYTHEPPCARHLAVILPNGHIWDIDGRANNCGSPCAICGVAYARHERGEKAGHYYDDAVPSHRCWQRHGDAIDRQTVNKVAVLYPGCDAGAGSIMSDAGGPSPWHGFMTAGELHP